MCSSDPPERSLEPDTHALQDEGVEDDGEVFGRGRKCAVIHGLLHSFVSRTDGTGPRVTCQSMSAAAVAPAMAAASYQVTTASNPRAAIVRA